MYLRYFTRSIFLQHINVMFLSGFGEAASVLMIDVSRNMILSNKYSSVRYDETHYLLPCEGNAFEDTDGLPSQRISHVESVWKHCIEQLVFSMMTVQQNTRERFCRYFDDFIYEDIVEIILWRVTVVVTPALFWVSRSCFGVCLC